MVDQAAEDNFFNYQTVPEHVNSVAASPKRRAGLKQEADQATASSHGANRAIRKSSTVKQMRSSEHITEGLFVQPPRLCCPQIADEYVAFQAMDPFSPQHSLLRPTKL